MVLVIVFLMGITEKCFVAPEHLLYILTAAIVLLIFVDSDRCALRLLKGVVKYY